MINQSKRQTISLLTAGLLASTLPTSVWSASSKTGMQATAKHGAYNGATLIPDVEVVVSTLGMHSAITTITNNSNKVVTITTLNPGLVIHNNRQFDINLAIGRAGVTVKPGQKRMLIAQETKSMLA